MQKHFIIFTLILTISLFFSTLGLAQRASQRETNIEALQQLSAQFKKERAEAKQEAIELAEFHNIPVRYEFDNGRIIELMAFEDGFPVYYSTYNLDAAITVRTDRLWPGGTSGYNLTGAGYNKIAVWDGGTIRTSHQEFGGRATQMDNGGLSDHATHVAGTMVATGVDPQAKGMSYEAYLKAYEWNSDTSEMVDEAAGGLQISNHSYGATSGWEYDYRDDGRWAWLGNTNISTTEDYEFGFYTTEARQWDQIAYNAPYYLMVKAAGNDRDDAGPGGSEQYWVYQNGWQLSTEDRDPDGQYDCMNPKSCAKNLLTVGAINDELVYEGPEGVIMSSFSSWGPTDDGRIKPDIVGNGVGVYSTSMNGDTSYTLKDGTSMASPNVAGALGLLQHYYMGLNGNSAMRASTLKALVIHTADECGPAPGPDYSYGWGLLNNERAINLIDQNQTKEIIREESLTYMETYSFDITSDGTEPLRLTMVWTDLPGTVPVNQVDPTDLMLVNDLDIQLTKEGETFSPWILDPENPEAPATTGDNFRDNVEQIYLPEPEAGTYTVTISHKGTLENAPQDYSLIITGFYESYLIYQYSEIDDTEMGNGNLSPDPGETVEYNIYIQNFKNDVAPNVMAFLINNDAYITMVDSITTFGDLQPGELKTTEMPFKFSVREDCPIWHPVTFELVLYDDSGHFAQYYLPELTITGVDVNLRGHRIDDSLNGNDDGLIDAGEQIELIYQFHNVGTMDISDVEIELTSEDANITIIDGNTTLNNIDNDLSIENDGDPFIIQIGQGVSPGDELPINISITGTGETYQHHENIATSLVIGDVILLVDDDDGAPWETYYTESLDDLGALYAQWNVRFDGVPPANLLSNYSKVIWFTGNAQFNTLTEEERYSISSYLDYGLGRNLFITGQDIGMDIGDTDFYADYLHAEFLADEWTGTKILQGLEGDPISDGITAVISGGFGADNQTSPSVITPLTDSYPVFQYFNSPEDIGAIRYQEDYKVIYFAFGFEAVNNTTISRTDLLDLILEFFNSDVSGIADRPISSSAPKKIILEQNHPNPFNPNTQITFGLPRKMDVELQIYDITGKLVKTLINEPLEGGYHSALWTGKDENENDVPSGLYFYQISSEDFNKTKQMLLIK